MEEIADGWEIYNELYSPKIPFSSKNPEIKNSPVVQYGIDPDCQSICLA